MSGNEPKSVLQRTVFPFINFCDRKKKIRGRLHLKVWIWMGMIFKSWVAQFSFAGEKNATTPFCKICTQKNNFWSWKKKKTNASFFRSPSPTPRCNDMYKSREKKAMKKKENLLLLCVRCVMDGFCVCVVSLKNNAILHRLSLNGNPLGSAALEELAALLQVLEKKGCFVVVIFARKTD